jgi:hypothetical protein
MITRGRIIYISILLAAAAVFFAVYWFYFKDKLATYARDREFKESLLTCYRELHEDFEGVKPEIFANVWTQQIQPWRDALAEAAEYYNVGGWAEHEPYPEEGSILRFWYSDQVNSMLWDLEQKVSESAFIAPNMYPRNLQDMTGVAYGEDWANVNVTVEEAYENLQRLSFAISLCELLIDAKASSIVNIVLWAPYTLQKFPDLGTAVTSGVEFTITMENLVALLEKLRMEDRYFSVDHFRITYPYIAHPQEPHLTVEMLLTQIIFTGQNRLQDAPERGAAGPAAGGSNARSLYNRQGMGARRTPQDRGRTQPQEPGFFGKMWKLFKRYVLYMN